MIKQTVSFFSISGFIMAVTVVFSDLKAQQMVSVHSIPVYTYGQIEPLFNPPPGNDTTYIFNFWATYCAPCIKELPYFDRLGKEYRGKPLKIILISMDFKSQIETRLIPFLKKNNIQSRVVVLSDPDANVWIDKVNNSWSGAIPATLIVKGNKREFYEKSFSYDELKLVTTKFLEK